MKLQTTLAVVLAALTIGVAGAAAAPDGYQPQLQGQAQTDAFDRYVRNNTPQPGATGSDGAAGHPDSLGVRPTVVGESEPVPSSGRDWTAGAFGALGGALIALLAFVGASAMRERRRLVLR